MRVPFLRDYMTRNIASLAAALLAATTLTATAAPNGSAPPKLFNDVGVTMQSRICGELMTSLAMGGVQALKMQFPNSAVPAPKRQAVYDTGAQAVILLAMSGSLTLDERLRAGELAQAIEKMAPTVHVDTARFCQRRVAAWLTVGQVDQAMVSQATAQAKVLMDKAFVVSDAAN
jgi:hypothetical protein